MTVWTFHFDDSTLKQSGFSPRAVQARQPSPGELQCPVELMTVKLALEDLGDDFAAVFGVADDSPTQFVS